MRMALVLVLAAGCGSVAVTAPDASGGAGGAQAGAEGGQDVGRVCDAPMASLSGWAAYVKGSAVAASPSAPANAPYGTCGGYVMALDASGYAQEVRAGQMADAAGWVDVVITAAVPAGSGCAYTLHGAMFLSAAGQPPCSYAADYLLTVP